MDQWRKDARKEPIIIDIDSLVPADHLLWWNRYERNKLFWNSRHSAITVLVHVIGIVLVEDPAALHAGSVVAVIAALAQGCAIVTGVVI